MGLLLSPLSHPDGNLALISRKAPLDRDQRANTAAMALLHPQKETPMTPAELTFLIVAVGAFSLFGGVLSWATWDEARRASKAHK